MEYSNNIFIIMWISEIYKRDISKQIKKEYLLYNGKGYTYFLYHTVKDFLKHPLLCNTRLYVLSIYDAENIYIIANIAWRESKKEKLFLQ